MRHALLVAAVVATISTTTTPAHALTIILRRITNTEFPMQTNGNSGGLAVPANTNCLFPSTGDVTAVVRAAAVYWQTIYTEPHTLTVTWGFSNNTGGFTADTYVTHTQASGSGAGRIDVGVLRINPNPPNCWYVDPDTASRNEYPLNGATISEQIAYPNQPGRTIEIGRFTQRALNGNASHRDLFDTVVHELGHLLGLSPGISRYSSEVRDGDIDVTSPRVIPNVSWQSSGGHLTRSSNANALMAPGQITGRRVWPSQADISSIAQISNWLVRSWGSGGGGPTGAAANNPLNP